MYKESDRIVGKIRFKKDVPVFVINHADLEIANPALASGKHILQIRYYAEDVVSVPGSNKADGIYLNAGFFIWYPESDNPQITTIPAIDKDIDKICLKVVNPMEISFPKGPFSSADSNPSSKSSFTSSKYWIPRVMLRKMLLL